MRPSIRVENLGKRYRVAHSGRASSYRTLRESLASAIALSPLILSRKGAGNGSIEDFWALRDVSFEVQPGEVVGVIGGNGAGKSTLLKILSRITKPTLGQAALRGRVSSLLEVGTGFHPELTGRENVFLTGSILGMARSEILRQFDAIVDFADVEQFIDTPVKRYSSGMYVRLAFAVSAHLQPDILIVDEVLAVGDAIFQQKCISRLEESSSGGRTVLVVSHNIPTILKLCSRALLLDAGKVVTEGAPNVVVEKYLQCLAPNREACQNLTKSRRPGWVHGRAHIMSCRLLHVNGMASWSVHFGTKIALELHVKVDRPIGQLEIGVAISTAAGFEIASPVSTDDRPWRSVGPNDYICTLEFPDLRLTPGRYQIGLGLRSDLGMEDYIPTAVSLDVTPTAESGAAGLDKRRGAVIPYTVFHHRD